VAHEVTRDQHQVRAFRPIHGCFGGFDVARRASFHFDDAQSIAVPADQVDFPSMLRRAEVAGDDGVTAPAKIEICFFLASPASSQVGGCLLRQEAF